MDLDDDPASEPRWLNADELDTWMAFSGMLLVLPGALDAQLQRDADLTLFGYLVLAGLSDAPERTLRMSALATLANGSLSRLSHAVARLERAGWVERRPCPDDGRFTIATLTDDGAAKLRATAPGHVEAVRRLVLDVIGTDDLDRLGAMSKQVLLAVTGKSAIA
ncbi:MarR family winged helix-turn-helix transcriptional regulator [Prauserella cavernicola]|uniref:MarR family transcriptional regulator n=1 Tax=Prauserella cavernicola TaxID=2800127 RepID=A0A934V1G0_9PSEU|nr:MarR family transcriptional regulator [Prauserella cavernicola]MBK1782831.1 MarR family transcriptional regulator [Prauserella cavernicola]